MFQKLDSLMLMAKWKIKAFLTDEKGDVNIVSMVVLIGMAVILAIVFRDQISELIKNLLNAIQKNAKDAIDSSALK